MRINLTDAEKYAYAAGILDGEGCIAIAKVNHPDSGSTYYKPRIYVVNTDKRIIEWFASNFGGCIYTKTSKGNCKTIYSWHLNITEQIDDFIRKLYPYLLIKLEKVHTLLFFLNRDEIGRASCRERV